MPSVYSTLLRGLGVVGQTVASAAPGAAGRPDPTATVRNGTYAGMYSPGYGQDLFLGMPYAQVPRRFTPAEGVGASWEGIREAKAYPPHCVGYGSDNVGYDVSEDCLYVNVVRPAGLQGAASLPVAVYIHGGALVMGGSADQRYNLSFIVQHSVDMGAPVVAASFNYRLSAFGFLAGREALAAGATDIGFRDQRLALQWLRENIAAFGGSPDSVTIFGESSGAESVTAQALAYNGRDYGLFRGAVAQSGFLGMLRRYPGGFNDTERMQRTYDELVRNTSCAGSVGTAASLECLRRAPLEELNLALNVSAIGPWPPVLDHDFIQDWTTNQLSQGNFSKVPLLIGSNSDEGTAFEPLLVNHTLNTDDDLREALKAILASSNTEGVIDQLVEELMYLYPDIQSVGIPSLDTWPHVIQPADAFAASLGAQYRRTVAMVGDLVMHYTRRRASLTWSKHGVPCYTYHFNGLANGVPPWQGASHFVDVAYVFLNLDGDGYETNPLGGSAEHTAKARALAETMATAWVNFFNGLDPNGSGGIGVEWPVYNASAGGGIGQDLVWDFNDIHVEWDDWRAGGINWMIENSKSVLGS